MGLMDGSGLAVLGWMASPPQTLQYCRTAEEPSVGAGNPDEPSLAVEALPLGSLLEDSSRTLLGRILRAHMLPVLELLEACMPPDHMHLPQLRKGFAWP